MAQGAHSTRNATGRMSEKCGGAVVRFVKLHDPERSCGTILHQRLESNLQTSRSGSDYTGESPPWGQCAAILSSGTNHPFSVGALATRVVLGGGQPAIKEHPFIWSLRPYCLAAGHVQSDLKCACSAIVLCPYSVVVAPRTAPAPVLSSRALLLAGQPLRPVSEGGGIRLW
uniref:Uncharacterized protein n=1 Tax=Eutreptiella gymnastica TaxID=73025 RepID=A0A7S4LJ52_9EUGL